MSVHATIIDHAELDRQVLSQALAQRGTSVSNALEKTEPAAAAVASVAALRQQQLAADNAQQLEAQQLFNKAAAYEAANQPGLAKIYFRMAAGRATGDLKTTALARIAGLEPVRGAKIVRD
jgi:hypothetical protein